MLSMPQNTLRHSFTARLRQSLAALWFCQSLLIFKAKKQRCKSPLILCQECLVCVKRPSEEQPPRPADDEDDLAMGALDLDEEAATMDPVEAPPRPLLAEEVCMTPGEMPLAVAAAVSFETTCVRARLSLLRLSFSAFNFCSVCELHNDEKEKDSGLPILHTYVDVCTFNAWKELVRAERSKVKYSTSAERSEEIEKTCLNK